MATLSLAHGYFLTFKFVNNVSPLHTAVSTRLIVFCVTRICNGRSSLFHFFKPFCCRTLKLNLRARSLSHTHCLSVRFHSDFQPISRLRSAESARAFYRWWCACKVDINTKTRGELYKEFLVSSNKLKKLLKMFHFV